ncbi:DNA repair protein RAD51 homolog 3 isoform X2 [Halyomorpha halys]|uniref:DNA repair protein RAD51 homolog 3 isoform X2 n=1 Tax=Halyomorpha halys TaxID=286706 RepID=UPI0006D4D43A|nr:DNA repair protein RAD51 homolog 3-like isoform X2 [Halyomorpha halys]
MRPLFTLSLSDIVISALGKAGYHKCEELFEEYQQKALDILKSFNLNFDDIKALMQGPGAITAAQLLRNEQMNEQIPTFSESLDKILGGGVQVGSLLQICGPPGSGKTQLVLQLCVNVQLPCALGGLESESVFIDTESTFSVDRLREIASGASYHCSKVASIYNLKEDMTNFTPDAVLAGVHYFEVENILKFMSVIEQLFELVRINKKIKCIVIDSFTFPFLRITNHIDRTRYISMIIQKLQDLALEHSVAIILNNHLTTKISQEIKVLAPALGESFSHAIPNTLLLGIVDNSFSAVMYKSYKLAEEVVLFKICSLGIRDI